MTDGRQKGDITHLHFYLENTTPNFTSFILKGKQHLVQINILFTAVPFPKLEVRSTFKPENLGKTMKSWTPVLKIWVSKPQITGKIPDKNTNARIWITPGKNTNNYGENIKRIHTKKYWQNTQYINT